MPETSIVLKANDQISASFRSIQNASKPLSKAYEDLDAKIKAMGTRNDALNKSYSEMSTQLVDAKKRLKEATAAYKEANTEQNKTNLEDATKQYKDLTDALKAYKDASVDTRKEIRTLQEEQRKLASGSGAGAAGGSESAGVLATLGKAGLAGMAGDLASEISQTFVASAFGSEAGSLFSGTLSGAASGAAMGSIIGPVGTAVGAAIGGGLGMLQGAAQNFEARDDAFKSYVSDAVDTVTQEQADSLTSGSTIAAGRETDRISFATLFEDAAVADTYLKNLVDMSNNTPFLYDDLTAMSKTLATYQYRANEILPVLKTIGDTGAALGQSTSDMNAIATAIGRMRSSNKATLDYLNILNDRGIGTVGMLADAKGVSQGDMYKMISKGQVSGQEAASIILQAMTDSFAGSMETQSKTFSGLTSTVEGLTQELDNAMGEGYNEGRMAGLQAQRDWLSGESGESMQDAYRMIGQWKASLENTKEQLEREALDAVMTGVLSDTFTNSEQGSRLSEMAKEYQASLAEYENGSIEAGNKMGALLAEAQVIAMNEYNDSDGAKLAQEGQRSLIASIRNDTSLNDDYWKAGYEKGQEFAKGLAAGMVNSWNGKDVTVAGNDFEGITAGTSLLEDQKAWLRDAGKYAYGLDYVPYDNFPALLHEGERVQTAAQAREDRSGGGSSSVVVSGNTFYVRDDGDVEAVAEEIVRQLMLADAAAEP